LIFLVLNTGFRIPSSCKNGQIWSKYLIYGYIFTFTHHIHPKSDSNVIPNLKKGKLYLKNRTICEFVSSLPTRKNKKIGTLHEFACLPCADHILNFIV